MRWQRGRRIYHHTALDYLVGERLGLRIHGEYEARVLCDRKQHLVLDHVSAMAIEGAAPNIVEHDWKSLLSLLQRTKLRRSKAPFVYSVSVAEHGGHQCVHKAGLTAVGFAEYYCEGGEPDYIAILQQRKGTHVTHEW